MVTSKIIFPSHRHFIYQIKSFLPAIIVKTINYKFNLVALSISVCSSTANEKGLLE